MTKNKRNEGLLFWRPRLNLKITINQEDINGIRFQKLSLLALTLARDMGVESHNMRLTG